MRSQSLFGLLALLVVPSAPACAGDEQNAPESASKGWDSA
jgi:hypothetical protein